MSHSHNIAHTKKSFLIAIVANGLFVIIQLFFAYVANSSSLLADAVHNLGDVFSLVVAWIGNFLLTKKPTSKATYGMKKASILAAFTNVLLLVFTCGIIVADAVPKFFHPESINNGYVIIVAGIGVVVNAATAFLFVKHDGDLNIRAAFLHLASDALISAGVVVAALIMLWLQWLWLDPLVGLLIAIIIFRGSFTLLIDSSRLIIDGVPSSISLHKVRSLLINYPGVEDVHDLHIWAMSTKENALSVHLFMPKAALTEDCRYNICNRLLREHNIHHVTIQVETSQNYCDHRCSI